MLNSSSSTTYLLICGDNLAADVITHKLQLAPITVTRKGELILPSLEDGAARAYDARFSLDCWKCGLTSKQYRLDLSKQLELWVEKLYPHRTSLKDIKDLGYWSVIDCQITRIDPQIPSFQFRLAQDLQLKLFKLGVDLDFTIYKQAS